MFILHVDSYRARAMLALRSRAVKKPYGASLNHAKLLECSGSNCCFWKGDIKLKTFYTWATIVVFSSGRGIINPKILSQGAIFNREWTPPDIRYVLQKKKILKDNCKSTVTVETTCCLKNAKITLRLCKHCFILTKSASFQFLIRVRLHIIRQQLWGWTGEFSNIFSE